jgi:hypothetical protein
MFDNLPNEQEPTPAPVKRPPSLTLICILTFIFSGLSFISWLFCSVYYYYLPDLVKSLPFKNAIAGIEGMAEFMKVMTETSIWYFIFNTILFGMSLAGAILMFRLKKNGFHLYTVAQILLLILPLIYLAGYKTEFTSTAITASFIFLYFTYLRIMK